MAAGPSESEALPALGAGDSFDRDGTMECETIKKLMEEHGSLKEGDTWYLISMQWWREWNRYSVYEEIELPGEKEDGESVRSEEKPLSLSDALARSMEMAEQELPGPIDNGMLCEVKDASQKEGKSSEKEEKKGEGEGGTPREGDGVGDGGSDTAGVNGNDIGDDEPQASDMCEGEKPEEEADHHVPAATASESQCGDGATVNDGSLSLIRNGVLRDDPHSNAAVLADELMERVHYVMVPEAVWEQLHKWYGGGPAFARKVIARGVSRALQVEVYPLTVRCMKIGAEEWPEFRCIVSKEEVFRRFVSEKLSAALYLPPHKIRCHLEKTEGEYIMIKDWSATMEDCRVQHNQRLLFEVPLPNGTYKGPPRRPAAFSSGGSLYETASYPPTQVGVTGLTNLGNTCFMNSVIQCLSNLPPFCEFFLSDQFKSEINKTNKLGTGGRLAKEYGKLMKKLWCSNVAYFPPEDFKYYVGRFAPRFTGFRQQDAQELLEYVLDGLHEDLNRVEKKVATETVEGHGRPDAEVAAEAWRVHMLRNQSIVVDLFQAQLRSSMSCPVCPNVSVTFDPYMYLSLPLPFADRVVRVILFRKGVQPPMRYAFTLPYDTVVQDLAAVLAKTAGVSQDSLIVTQADSTYTQYLKKDSKFLHEMGQSDKLIVYEMDVGEKQLATPGVADNKTAEQENQKLTSNQKDDKPPDTSEKTKGDRKALASSIDRALNAGGGAVCRFIFRRAKVVQSSTGSTRSEVTQIGLPFLLPVSNTAYSHTELCEAVERCASVYLHQGSWDSPQAKRAVTSSSRSPYTKRPMAIQAGAVQWALSGTSEQTHGSTRASTSSPYASGSTYRSVYSSYSHASSYTTTTKVIGGAEMVSAKSASESSFGFSLRVVSQRGNSCGAEGCRCRGCPLETIVQSLKLLGGQTIAVDLYEPAYWKTPVEHETAQSSQNVKSKAATLISCIEKFQAPEVLGEDDLWYCPNCKEHRAGTKELTLWSLPVILIIQLKRFRYSRQGWREKLSTFISFPLEGLDLTPYEQSLRGTDAGVPAIYDLRGIVVRAYAAREAEQGSDGVWQHHSGGTGGGHYIAFAQNKVDSRWYEFNDRRTSVVTDESRLVSSGAYLLFYQRRI